MGPRHATIFAGKATHGSGHVEDRIDHAFEGVVDHAQGMSSQGSVGIAEQNVLGYLSSSQA